MTTKGPEILELPELGVNLVFATPSLMLLNLKEKEREM